MTDKINYKGIDKLIETAEEEVTKERKISEARRLKEEGWIITADKKLLSRLKNILMVFKTDEEVKDMLEYNEFSGDIIYIKKSPWGDYVGEQMIDAHDILFKAWLSEKYKFEPSTNLINEAVITEAWSRKRHPVKEYLESLKWDGKKRVCNWLVKAVHCDDNEYTREVGKKLLCAMVKRIYQKGCKYDQMIIFEGKQGIYKSTMLEVLAGKWHATLTNIQNNKAVVDVMRGKWLLEIAELAEMRKTDVEHIKAFLSCRIDRVRLSYGRRAEDFPRQSIICGTMNPVGDNEYFRDASGNRRFWPIVCNKDVEIFWVTENRDQLFAETMQIWEKEDLYMTTKKAKEIAIQEQEKRKVSDAWEDIIQRYIDKKDHISMQELIMEALHIPLDRVNRAFSIRLGLIMRQLGWISTKYGRKQTKFFVKKGTDINAVMEQVERLTPMWDE